MKLKIKILLVFCVIAITAFTGFNLVQNRDVEVSLVDITLMARADPEEPTITCNQHWFNGARCWQFDFPSYIVHGKPCFWTGNQADFCNYIW